MIMLEGFAWESYKKNEWGTTKWRDLLNQVDEINDYFDEVWLPPSHMSRDGMGYWPLQLSNQNGQFGSRKELEELIDKFHEGNTTVYADLIMTHKKMLPNGTFMKEQFDHCHRLNIKDFFGKIEHDEKTGCELYYQESEKVREMIGEYIDFLENEIGYDGFRIDIAKMLKSDYGVPLLSDKDNVIHEYYDTNYDLLKNYMKDYPSCHRFFNFNIKYRVFNDGIAKGDFSKLIFEGKPGGLMDSDLRKQCVNFVENHDTQDNFASFVELHDLDKIKMANALLLMTNADCCVFWPHWVSCKEDIKKFIEIRRAYNITKDSDAKIIFADENNYLCRFTNSGSNDMLYLLLKKNHESRVKCTGPLSVIHEGEYFSIWGNKSVEFSTKEYPQVVIEPRTFTLKIDKLWNDTYMWTDDLKWPGKKLSFKNNKPWSCTYENSTGIEFTLHNNDENNPIIYQDMLVNKDTYIKKESIR